MDIWYSGWDHSDDFADPNSTESNLSATDRLRQLDDFRLRLRIQSDFRANPPLRGGGWRKHPHHIHPHRDRQHCQLHHLHPHSHLPIIHHLAALRPRLLRHSPRLFPFFKWGWRIGRISTSLISADRFGYPDRICSDLRGYPRLFICEECATAARRWQSNRLRRHLVRDCKYL